MFYLYFCIAFESGSWGEKICSTMLSSAFNLKKDAI
jgi:hypothetical protein